MTVKQEQKLIVELGKLITALNRAQDLANKLGANTTAGDLQLHTIDIKHSIEYHMWHIAEVTTGNII